MTCIVVRRYHGCNALFCIKYMLVSTLGIVFIKDSAVFEESSCISEDEVVFMVRDVVRAF